MDDKELIKLLRDYAQAYVNDNHYDFNPGVALMIANRMEQLIALAENGQSAIDTNQRLTTYISDLKTQCNDVFVKLALKTNNICSFCKHNTPCKGKECDDYCEGKGLEDENGNYIDVSWTCEDFDWASCPKMIHTPCNKCGSYDNFEWNGENDIKN